jgi:hypothetical protein
MKLLPAIFSAVLAVSFSSLAAAQSSTATDTNRAATGASDMDKKPAKKSAKKSTKAKAKAKANAKAAGGSSSAGTSADGRDNAAVSSPSQNSGTPGSANQGSVHNDQTKK